MADHSIAHVEIASGNPDIAGKFYEELFGWSQIKFPESGYLLLQPTNGATGAVVPVGQSYFNFKPESVLVYVSTDDVAASLSKAEALGATVVLPQTTVPGTGDIGIFQDPTGNYIGLYKPIQKA